MVRSDVKGLYKEGLLKMGGPGELWKTVRQDFFLPECR